MGHLSGLRPSLDSPRPRTFNAGMSRSRIINLANLPQFTAINVLSDPGHDPTPKPVVNCMEVRLNWTLEDLKLAHNVLHVRYANTYPGSVSLANQLQANVIALNTSSNLIGQLSGTTAFVGVSLKDKGVLDGPYTDSSGAAQTGTGAGMSLPNEVAAVLTERTAVTGRGAGRGRIYMMGFTVGQTAPGNVIVNSCATALTAWGNGIANALAPGGVLTLMLPSRVGYTGSTGTVHPPRTPRTQDVTQIVLRDNHWDSQRRRGLK